MRKAAACATAVVLALGLAACDDEARFVPGPGPGPSKVDVDTPELRALKTDAGIEPCTPGPGGGALSSLTLPCLGGGVDVDLATLKGPMVLSYWGSYCAPCETEMPALQEFHETYGARVPVLGVDFNDTYPGSALEQMGEREVTYPSLADPGGDSQGSRQLAQVAVGLPYLVLLDADGKVAYQKNGGISSADQLVDLVDEHLGLDL